MTTDTNVLYRVGVDYSPPGGASISFGTSGYGTITLGSPTTKAWNAAWDRATRIEKVQNARWVTNVMCRTWAALVGELIEANAVGSLLNASIDDMVNPVEVIDEFGYPGDISFTVEDVDAKQWVARTKQIVNDVIAADAGVASLVATQVAGHAGRVKLSGHATTSQEQQQR